MSESTLGVQMHRLEPGDVVEIDGKLHTVVSVSTTELSLVIPWWRRIAYWMRDKWIYFSLWMHGL